MIKRIRSIPQRKALLVGLLLFPVSQIIFILLTFMSGALVFNLGGKNSQSQNNILDITIALIIFGPFVSTAWGLLWVNLQSVKSRRAITVSLVPIGLALSITALYMFSISEPWQDYQRQKNKQMYRQYNCQLLNIPSSLLDWQWAADLLSTQRQCENGELTQEEVRALSEFFKEKAETAKSNSITE